jgi:sulfatase maturation enzyme AslB (radical SAM superfamily)
VEKAQADTVDIASCCVNRTHRVSRIDFVEDHTFQQQRRGIEAGHQIINCASCWQQEQAGGHSIRMNMLDRLRSADPYSVELLNLDYNVDPVCNGQCIICGPNYSSAWLAEEQRYSGNVRAFTRTIKEIKNNDLLATVDLSQLQRVYFNGGEPLLTDEHIQVLKRIPDISQVDVAYNTNGSQYPSDQALSLWSRAKSVTVNVSVDGTDSTFEYTRYPIKFAQVNNVVQFLSELDIDVNVSYTVGIHNLLAVKQTQQWAGQYTDHFYLQPVNGMLSVVNAEPRLKEFFLEYLGNEDWAEPYINLINQEFSRVDHHWQQRLTELDIRRGLDWRRDLTELAIAYKIIGLDATN